MDCVYCVYCRGYSSSISPSNVHQRMLHFMRPDGMDTVSPAHVQQSLMKKYQGDYKYQLPCIYCYRYPIHNYS